MLGKVSKIVIHNPSFWILSVSGVALALYHRSKDRFFSWTYVLIQSCIGVAATFCILGAFILWTTDVEDTEIWNGKVLTSEYYEEWTELVHYTETICSGSGSNQTCVTVPKTRIDHHPPYWVITDSNGEETQVSKEIHANYVKTFGNSGKVVLHHSGQISIGDGDKYVARWNAVKPVVVPASSEHKYVNYLRASSSILKYSGLTGPYKPYLLPYPGTYSGPYGPIEFNRVLSVGTNVPEEWKKSVNRSLNLALADLGATHQLNVMVYLVGTSDRGFLHALEEHWVFGKKNDVTVVVGVPEFPKVAWSGIMIFQGNESLRVNLRDAIEFQGDLSDPGWFARTITERVSKEFRRVPMSELEYLLYSIHLPWWATALLFATVGFPLLFFAQFYRKF